MLVVQTLQALRTLMHALKSLVTGQRQEMMPGMAKSAKKNAMTMWRHSAFVIEAIRNLSYLHAGVVEAMVECGVQGGVLGILQDVLAQPCYDAPDDWRLCVPTIEDDAPAPGAAPGADSAAGDAGAGPGDKNNADTGKGKGGRVRAREEEQAKDVDGARVRSSTFDVGSISGAAPRRTTCAPPCPTCSRWASSSRTATNPHVSASAAHLQCQMLTSPAQMGGLGASSATRP